VLVADRFHAKAGGLAAAEGLGARFVVRYGMTGCALPDGGGRAPDRAQGRARARGRAAGRGRPPGAGAAARRRAADRRAPGAAQAAARGHGEGPRAGPAEGQEAGRAPTPPPGGSPAPAGWLALLTTLGGEVPAGQAALALHGLRWQVELAFKRLKGQLRLDGLQAKDPRLARAALPAKLLLAALADQVLGEALALSPRDPARPPSPWRLARLALTGLLAALLPGELRPRAWPRRLGSPQRSLSEPPRRRSSRLADAWRLSA
jgi:hypothetical protein